jgi:glycosyltransferase involved in cell wall biosynthesis
MRVAIIIPAYNSSATLEATLRSVQEQSSFSRLAFVCVADDASTDDTCAKARTMWASSTELRVITASQNRGERANVNAAINQVTAGIEWFFLLHADDLAKANWLSLMLDQMGRCSDRVASICSSWDNLLPGEKIVPGEDNPARPVEIIAGTHESVRNTLLRGCWWHVSGCAIRTSAFQEIGGFNEAMPQLGDWDWLLRALAGGWSIEYIPRTLIQYRQHPASISASSFRQHRDIQESLRIVQQFDRFLRFSDIIRFHIRRIVYTFRRTGRAILKVDAARIAAGWGATLLVAKSLSQLVGRRIRLGNTVRH